MDPAESARGSAEGQGAQVGRPAGPVVWGLRLVTASMLLLAVVVGAKKFRSTPEQEELKRYGELTVPAYLREWADVSERLDRLRTPGLDAARARALLVDEVMPLAIRARKHATQVVAESPLVQASNAEYLRALEQLMEVARTAVAAIDDPALGGAQGLARVREQRRQADESLRAWMTNLRERCRRAGLELEATAPEPSGRER